MRTSGGVVVVAASLIGLGLAFAAPPDPKDEAEKMLAAGLPFAEKLLHEYGSFHPFANALGSDGAIAAVGVDLHEEHPDAQHAIDALATALRVGIAKGRYKAGAIFVDVRAQPPGRKEMVDAVRIGVEHVGGFCSDVFVPYTLDGAGGVKFGETWASEHKGQFTNACH